MDNFIVITAPSGTGKTTLIKRYIGEHSNIYFSISHTTRTMRNNEKDGIDYYFISKEEFQNKIESSDFIEWANVHGNFYGTSFAEIEKAKILGKVFLLDIDVQGAINLMKQSVKAKYIFIMPPSLEELEKRLIARNTDSQEIIASRIANAKAEIDKALKFDYIILNDNLERAYGELCNIIDKGSN